MLITIDQLPGNVLINQRLMGLDLGDKTIGIALSDTRRKVASPHSTLKRKDWKTDSNALVNLVETYDVGGFILGMPYNMNGSEGERCQITRKFANKFLSFYDLPLVLWDERLSTKAATDIMRGDLSRTKRDLVVDKVAAAYILQGALDYMSYRIDGF